MQDLAIQNGEIYGLGRSQTGDKDRFVLKHVSPSSFIWNKEKGPNSRDARRIR